MDLSDLAPWFNREPTNDIVEPGYDEDGAMERLQHDCYTAILKAWVDGKIMLSERQRRALIWYLMK